MLVAGVDEAGLGQKLQRAGEARDDVDHILQAMREVEHSELAHRVRLADERLEHRMRTLVRRAEHHEARTVARHQLVPQRRVLVDQRAHDKPAHAVREDAHRLQRRERRVELLAQRRGERVGQHVERLAPVVRKRDDALAALQVLLQVAVELREHRLGLHRVALRVRLEAQLREPAERERVELEPDALAPVQPQVRSGDAGQQHGDRQRCDRSGRAACGDARVGDDAFVDAAQRLERFELIDRRFEQPAAQRAARRLVDEVAEMVDFGAFVEQHRRGLRSRDAGAHRVGVDDEVVVAAVEEGEVGEQHAQALEPAAAFDVAADDRELHPVLHRRAGEKTRHRRLGQHRFDAGNEVRLGAIARDFEHDALERRVDRVAFERRHPAHQRQQRRQEDVEVAAREPRAARRARNAHVALRAGREPFQLDGARSAGSASASDAASSA